MTSTTLDARNGDSVATEFLDALARQDRAVVQSLLDHGIAERVRQFQLTGHGTYVMMIPTIRNWRSLFAV
jgi:hypothetical protein